MQSLLRIKHVNDLVLSEILNQIKSQAPRFGEEDDLLFHNRNQHAFVLSKKAYWKDNHNEIIKNLTVFSDTLDYAYGVGASLELDIGIHAINYKPCELLKFEFSEELLQLLAKHRIYFSISAFIMRPFLIGNDEH
jgi:hypothetical protein